MTRGPGRQRLGLAALVLVLALLAGAPQRAAGADEPKPPMRTLDEVDVIAAPPQDDRRESTTTRIVVSHDEIVRYGDTSLADVLKRLPGVTIEGVTGRGSVVIRLRGLGTGYTQLLLDGEPVPPGFSLDSLQPSQIERIEILRAPTADLGTQAIAGTINIVLRKTATATRRRVDVTAGAERSHPLYGVDADLAGGHAAWSWILAAAGSRERHDYPARAEQRGTDASGETNLLWITAQREAVTLERASLTPRMTWKPSDDDTVAADGFLRVQRLDDVFGESTTTLVGTPPVYAADDLPFRVDNTTVRLHVDWTHRWRDGSSLDTRLGYDRNRREGSSLFHGFDAAGAFILDRSVLSRATDQGATARAKYLTPVIEGHALSLGVDAQFTQRDERRYQVDTTPGAGAIDILDETYLTRLARVAVYAQDEWDITRRGSAYWGMRYEALDTRTTGNVIEATGNHAGVLSPILQTLWKSADAKGDQVRASVARTFKAPSTFQLTPRRYVANNNTATTPDFQGNPDLRPEVAWGIDVAYEHYFADDGLVSVSAYGRRIDDVILVRLANVNGTWIDSPVNAGVAAAYGIEAEAKANLRTWHRRAPNVALHANLAFNRSRLEDVPGPDNRLGRQVPWSANAGFDWVFDAMPLTIGVNFSYQAGGRVRTSFTEAEFLPYKRLFDTYALWKLDARTSLRLSLANVLAQDRYAWTSHFDETGALQLTTTSPSRTVVRLAVEFTL